MELNFGFCLLLHKYFKYAPTYYLEGSAVDSPGHSQRASVVVLQHLHDSHHFLPGHVLQGQLVQVVDDHPVLNLTWQKHVLFDILQKKNAGYLHSFQVKNCGVLAAQLFNHVGVKDDAGTEELVSAMDVQETSVLYTDGNRYNIITIN